MDYIGYVDSSDIAEFMRKIGYEPTGFEAAFLVWRSIKKSLKEKTQAWRQIIEDFPNEELERERLGIKLSLHEFLQEYMELQRKKLESFFDNEACVYRYSWHYKKFRRNAEDSGYEECDSLFFETAQECQDYIREQEGSDRAEGVCDEKNLFFIEKVPLGTSSDAASGTLTLNEDLDPVSIDVAGISNDEDQNIDLAFECMWFSFPTPFQRGDILTLTDDSKSIFVLDNLCTWGNDAMRRNGLPDKMPNHRRDASQQHAHYLRFGDTSDMGAGVFTLTDEFELCRSHGGWPDYLDLKYYRGPDTDEVKGLKAVSCYLKNECDLTLLMDYLEFLKSKDRMDSFRFAEESFERYIFPKHAKSQQ